MTALTPREEFLTLLYNRVSYPADVIVVLCGEDVGPRLEWAYNLFRSGWAPKVLLSGGRHEPPRYVDAVACKDILMGKGIAPDRIETEILSQNTWGQAQQVVHGAEKEKWSRVILVASAFHIARAFLTFVHALKEYGLDEKVRLVAAPASAAWYENPEAMEATRLELASVEAIKTEEYRALGHVASYEDGAAYLRFWEGQK